jgi:hypothetical protein
MKPADPLQHFRNLLAAPAVEARRNDSITLWTIVQVLDNNRVQLRAADAPADSDEGVIVSHIDLLTPVNGVDLDRWLAERKHEHSFTKVDTDGPREQQCPDCLHLWDKELLRRTEDEEFKKARDANDAKMAKAERDRSWVDYLSRRFDVIQNEFKFDTHQPMSAVVAALIVADAVAEAAVHLALSLDQIADRLAAIQKTVER